LTVAISTTVPAILLDEPTPKSTLRSFHRRKLQIWEGCVPFDHVRGWVQNRRTELLVDNWRMDSGREPDDDELYHLVLDDEIHKIKSLADNIFQNGVRMPLILASDGRLLDGNRRYFAVRHLLETLKPSERADFKILPAWVLASTDPDDENNVITERNLVDDQKEKWPYYVIAEQVYEDRMDQGLTIKEIAAKYDMQTTRVRAMISAVELANEFVGYHEEDDREREARRLAYENLIWFDQLQRSQGKLLDTDSEFKEAVFRMLLEEPAKFGQARDFVKLGEIRRSKKAWATLTSVSGPAGLEQADQVMAAEKLDAARDPVGKLDRIVLVLKEVATAPELHTAPEDLLASFHRLAMQVPAGPSDPEWRIGQMFQWLDEMTVAQISTLTPETLDRLSEAQARVKAMAEAWPGSQA
jgi:hypothetical protein